MPYKDIEARKKAQMDYIRKKRGIDKGIDKGIDSAYLSNPKDGIDNVIPVVDPSDWSDRRNYSAAYLRCLDEQGGSLTQASQVAMVSYVPTAPEHWSNLAATSLRRTPSELKTRGDLKTAGVGGDS